MGNPNSIRVRFAPSPTGYLHIGGARTALFNWLFARRHGGTFILRIEDTDVERSSEEMAAGILDALTWLGLHLDEGPYLQSERSQLYRDAAIRLIEDGAAYNCLCPPGKHDIACRDRSLRTGGGAVRYKVSEGAVGYHDEVFGSITVDSSTIEDFVLLRSDGHPTYHLSVVVDDVEMGITHVIRGTDHISNTPKQILLYQALGARVPAFAHVPLILGPDKARLSKRHGATSVAAYRDQGILPEALRNFLALLGWSPGTDQEMFQDDDLIREFSLAGISKANAVFNLEKLWWFNAQYLGRLPHDRLVDYLKPEFEKAGVWSDYLQNEGASRFRLLLDVLRPRSKSLHDFVPQARPFLAEEIEPDPAAVSKFLKDLHIRQHLKTLADRLNSLPDFNQETSDAALRSLANELGLKPPVLMNASRVALTGRTVSPGIFDVMVILGRERTVQRLRAV